MSDSSQADEKISLPRLLVGLGFLLILVAVGIGAATTKAGDLPKYLAGAGLLPITIGVIWIALQGRKRPAV